MEELLRRGKSFSIQVLGRELQSKGESPLGPLSLSGVHSEKVTILSCLVSAFSPPLFSPRLGRFFRFFNESLHESCNRIKDILSSRSVCLMPSIESIGAISSLGGRAIDSSCPWLVKGMRRCKSIQIDRGVPNQQQALSNVLGEGSAAEAKKSNQCSFRAQPKDPILAAAGALDGTGKTVHE
ncbi:hypothetical protein L1887_59825 [Cichorium endivia]|nr:hypothetical protein L1887_59825 [Cichorium endivia]